MLKMRFERLTADEEKAENQNDGQKRKGQSNPFAYGKAPPATV